MCVSVYSCEIRGIRPKAIKTRGRVLISVDVGMVVEGKARGCWSICLSYERCAERESTAALLDRKEYVIMRTFSVHAA